MHKFMYIFFPITLIVLFACEEVSEPAYTIQDQNPFVGAWQLVEGTVITNGDTVVTDYTGDTSLLKIINETHFAFLMHDKHQGKDSTTAFFVAGGGRCELTDSTYTEHLDYCNARDWEGHTFHFKISLVNDTLTQHGRENAEGAGVDRVIIEKYVRAR